MKENKLYRFIEFVAALGVFALLLILIIRDNRYYYVYQSFCKVPNWVWAVFTAALLGILTFVGKRKSGSPMRRKIPTRNLLILSGLFLVMQIFLAWQIYFRTGWDCGILVEMAQKVAYESAKIGSDAYFSMYPNNVLLVAVFAAILRLVRFIGWNADYFPLIIVGCFLVQAAGFFLMDCIRQLTGKDEIALGFWVVFYVLAGFSPWISIPYSDTYAIVFPIFCIWLYIKENERNQYLVWALIGLFGRLGSSIKPTVILVVLVLAVLKIWHFICGIRRKNEKCRMRKYMLTIVAFAGGIILAWGVGRVAQLQMGYAPDHEAKFTPMHYLMMGLNEESGGTYDQQDVNFSASAATIAERNQKTLAVCKERVSQMGLKGTMIHFVRKLMTNFNDGTFAWGHEGAFYWQIRETDSLAASKLRSYFYEDGSDYYLFQIVAQPLWQAWGLSVVL